MGLGPFAILTNDLHLVKSQRSKFHKFRLSNISEFKEPQRRNRDDIITERHVLHQINISQQ